MKYFLGLICLLGLLLIFLGAGTVFFYKSGEPSPQAGDYIQGVDVARYQGDINWPELARQDIRFAWIKASEGGDYVDPKFEQNWQGAQAAGVLRGAYHFFTLCKAPEAQAANFLRVMGDPSGALPPVIDLEHMGPCREQAQLSDPAASAKKFMDIIEAQTGARPIIYTTRQFHDRYLKDWKEERFWVRSIMRPPRFRAKEWLIWQHHNAGRLRGVEGEIDLNAFRGSEAELRALVSE